MRRLLLLLLSLALQLPGFAASERPNIVLVLIDDLGAEAIGCYGGESYSTPHMDALAEKGMRFENAYSMPACMPSRVTLMTGRYAFRSNLPYNDTPWVKREGWGKGEITFANLLQEVGYTTAFSGKWQLCLHDVYPDHLDQMGFQFQNAWGWERGEEFTRRYWKPTFYRDHEWLENVEEIYGPDEFCRYLTDFAAEAEEKGHAPFFAYYAMTLLHSPWPQTPDNLDVPQPGWTAEDNLRSHRTRKWSQANFDAMVAYADKLIGRLAAKIEELGLAENTLLLVTSDNGTIPAVTSRYDGKDVRGGKMRASEAGTRIPFFAVWPGHIEPGSVNTNLVDFSDFMPTIAEIAGAELPKDRVIDGQSFADQLLGEEGAPARSWVYARYGDRAFVRGPRYRLSMNGDLHDMSVDRYAPTLVPRAESLPKTKPEAEATQERMRLREVFLELEHPVGPNAKKAPRLEGVGG